MHKPILAAAAFVACATAAPAYAKEARCVIDSEGVSYNGPCNYTVAKGGTFTVTPPHGRGFGGETLSITVYVTRPGFGEIRGLTEAGINSRWGQARRSRRDAACWQGNGFSVCVY
ncbi:hypothetical protein FPZ24_00200 [Sphingomonas panacisoli]|uniref:Uncharacterized protein n=1 Tax=Sphingomonas panacisoli TaxID=1813879 RepID=A0A5B8LEB1_9SPHN|nr:hypothetical protein [Sphingomonas panacisoli]QDZ06084.1 hypothetical protein FPZ24_00200 [Sphingomonas panacisoli]